MEEIKAYNDPIETQLLHCAGSVLGTGVYPAIQIQMVRVLKRLCQSNPERLERISGTEDMIQAFRTKKRIPESLTGVLPERVDHLELSQPVALAISFTVAIYPQLPRVKGELSERGKVFIEQMKRLKKLQQYPDLFPTLATQKAGLLEQFHDLATPREIQELVAALSFTENPSDFSSDEILQRRNGAILHLMTCTAEMAKIMINNFREDKEFLHNLRVHCSSPPSILKKFDQSIPAHLIKRFHELEGVTKQKYCKKYFVQEVSDQNMTDIHVIWNRLWEKLRSGFLYYSFKAHLIAWWKESLNGEKPFITEEIDENMQSVQYSDIDVESLLELGTLRAFREGYRLVRTSFFDREKETTGFDEHDSSIDKLERHREAVDTIWYLRLMLYFGDIDSDTLPLKEISKQHPELSESAIVSISSRLKNRMHAYYLSRFKSFPPHEILKVKKWNARTHCYELPFEDESGVPWITSIALLAAPKETLLYAFTAKICFHSHIYTNRKDQWDLKRYLNELRIWISDDAFNLEEVTAYMARRKSSFYRDMHSALCFDDIFKTFLEALRDTHSETRLAALASDFESNSGVGKIKHLLQPYLGSEPLFTFEREIKEWKTAAYEQASIVPLWYLVCLEQLSPSVAATRLLVPSEHRESAENLASVIAEANRKAL